MPLISFFFVVFISIREVKGTHLDNGWSEECDPWKVFRPVVDSDYTNCPQELRSASGCGDFVDDPRNDECTGETPHPKFDVDCSRRIIHTMMEPAVNNPDLGIVPGNNSHMHACVDELITYPVQRYALPPSTGMHRERWATYGEYEYLPMPRWLHNLEHGTVAFLYDHCMPREEVCKLKSYILSIADDITGPFRWVLSPGPRNRVSSGTRNRRLAIVVWGQALITDCWNPDDWDTFLDRYYRWTSPEDYPPSGDYNHTYVGQDPCPDTPPYVREENPPPAVKNYTKFIMDLFDERVNHGENACPSLICLLISAICSLVHFMYM